MSRISLFIPAAIALLATGAAHAEAFVTGSIGQSRADAGCPDIATLCDRRDTAGTLRAGYWFAPWLALEARYFDLGRTRFDYLAGTQTFPDTADIFGKQEEKFRGAGVNAILAWPFADRWRLTGTAGIARVENKGSTSFTSTGTVTGIGVDATVKKTEPYYGVGLAYDMTKDASVALEADRYRAPGLFGDTRDIDTVGVAFSYRFR